MKPLPVRPVDRIANLGTQAPLARTAIASGRVMRPLPLPTPEGRDLASAIRTAAYQRMLANHGHVHTSTSKPLPVKDRT